MFPSPAHTLRPIAAAADNLGEAAGAPRQLLHWVDLLLDQGGGAARRAASAPAREHLPQFLTQLCIARPHEFRW